MSFVVAAVIAMLSRQDATAVEPRLLRYPAIHGDTVVFSYAGDLWVAKTSGGTARRLTSHPGLEIRPHISEDGKTVAFTGQYDGPSNIYTIPIEGGEPKRLTYDSEADNCIGFTPSGDVAYASVAGNFTNRQQRLWTVDTKGGFPKRTPLDEVAELSYFSDGKTVAYNRAPSAGFNWRHYRGGNQGRISFYNFATNAYSELAATREQSYYPMVVGQTVYYISDRAGGVLNLYRHDMNSGKDEQLTHFTDADIRTPSTDGKTIVFERNGYMFLYDIASGKVTQPDIRVLGENLNSRPYLRRLGDQVSGIGISPSGTRVAVEARGIIFSVPARQGDTRKLADQPGARQQDPHWSPDGKTIAFISDASGDEQVYTAPELGGAATRLTSADATEITGIEWSPDGKFIQVQRVDNTMWIVEVASKHEVKVIDAAYGLGGTSWSPDSKWLALTNAGPNLQGALYLYEVATAHLIKVDSGYYNDGDVAFDQNGKYLYMISDREFVLGQQQIEQTPFAQRRARIYVIPLAKDTPNPLTAPNDEEPDSATGGSKPSGPGGAPGGPSGGPGGNGGFSGPPGIHIDVDGMADRILALPVPAGAYGGVDGSTNGVFYFANGALNRFDLGARESAPVFVAPFGARLSFNPNHSKIAYQVGATIGVIDLHPGPPATPGQGKVSTDEMSAVIDPHDEWRQIFWEAWRFERDHFYDPGMHGLNWKEVGDHYAQFLPYVNSRTDLSYVLGLMLGELGTSHAYVIGGEVRGAQPPIPVGYLGADYDISEGHVRFAKILRGHSYDDNARGPLAEPGVVVHEGEYLLAIDGVPLTANTNPNSLMLGATNRFVTLTVNTTPTDAGSRKIRVRPIASEGNLRYWDWADRMKAMVDKLSGGRIGYVHVRDTGETGTVDLTRGFLAQTDKDAFLVDERWNGGGNLPTGFVETLARHANVNVFTRYTGEIHDAYTIEGPKAMLINGYAGSGGDMFPWLFRKSNVGPLIGRRTWGGLVGYNAPASLLDGGAVTSPEAAMVDRTTGEIVAENTGITPDIDVDLRPDLEAKGEDPQIEAAVKYLLDQLAKLPPKKPLPKVPTVNKAGRIGG